MALTSEISSLTQKYLVPKLIDNIFDSNILFQRAKKKGWYETIDGGTSVSLPLAYATTANAQRYSGSETLDISDTPQITEATFEWKEYAASIPVTRIDELKNSGKNAIVNLIKAKVQLAEKSLKNLLGTDMFNDGTTSKALIGLKLATAITGTYGTIAKGTYSWWQGNVDSTTTGITLSALQALQGDCTVDSDKPTVYVTTQDIFDDLWSAIQPQQRFADEDTFKAGFTNLLVNGIPVIVDSHCPSGYLFALNESYLHLYAHKDENFRFAPFRQPTNQNAKVAQIFWTGMLACDNCRMQGAMSALT